MNYRGERKKKKMEGSTSRAKIGNPKLSVYKISRAGSSGKNASEGQSTMETPQIQRKDKKTKKRPVRVFGHPPRFGDGRLGRALIKAVGGEEKKNARNFKDQKKKSILPLRTRRAKKEKNPIRIYSEKGGR